ncbi:MAG: hypothetical protein JNM36_01510 [Chitinophagales bacterium]|jgi:hypothetical protein|nr:hypothetical protein [Chitinophagales bacterium]
MTIHNGIIEIKKIENQGHNADKIGLLIVQFVHYPDCQQLQVWLPKSNYLNTDYGNYQIIKQDTQTLIESNLISNAISGGRQMLIDTIEYVTGTYLLAIEHPEGGTLCLYFQKNPEIHITEEEKKQALPRDDSWRLMGW